MNNFTLKPDFSRLIYTQDLCSVDLESLIIIDDHVSDPDYDLF